MGTGSLIVQSPIEVSEEKEESELEEEVVNKRCCHRYGLRHPFAGVFFEDTRGVVSQDNTGLF